MKAQNLAITMKGRFRMSGFAADVAAAEQLLVAHVLTVKRIRELNANQSGYAKLGVSPSGRWSRLAVSKGKLKGALIDERENKLL
jgi:hypothetical protein